MQFFSYRSACALEGKSSHFAGSHSRGGDQTGVGQTTRNPYFVWLSNIVQRRPSEFLQAAASVATIVGIASGQHIVARRADRYLHLGHRYPGWSLCGCLSRFVARQAFQSHHRGWHVDADFSHGAVITDGGIENTRVADRWND